MELGFVFIERKEAMEIPARYNPKEVEAAIYRRWEESGFFHADVNDTREPFTVVIPPPNVTGSLHMGHALNNTLQDVVIRHRRMSGYNALWVPGTDHAGIGTQVVIERELKAQGKTRTEIGREKFLEITWQWKEKYGNRIIDQLKALGCSCDWERLRFTMDDGLSYAVRYVFVKLYREGLIYRGNYMVNWCPRCLTALSDLEVEHKVEDDSRLYYIKYQIKGEDDYLTVATTRPETMLGDSAVAVNPDDERYKKFIGRTAILPIVGRELIIIADEATDMEFGTGALKVTPAHDPVDYELGRKHGLEFINVMDPDGRMNEAAGEFCGMSREDARSAIIKRLEQDDLLVRVEKYSHSIGRCHRCDEIVEPYISTQWFVRMKPLAVPAIKAVEDGRITFVPGNWEAVYFNWMNNIRDWCISRQLWWGHRIPVWYCDLCGELIVELEDPKACTKCGGRVRQDEDVLDTWFSSWLWPFSTLGWPKNKKDMEVFYPTDLLVTAHDIIFFWVARMIMAGIHFAGDIPFEKVFINPIVNDSFGQKMSKSKGNVIDPLDQVEKYGADALRFTLSFLTTPGRDIAIGDEKIEGMRNFANKIWNASRFILQNAPKPKDIDLPESGIMRVHDRWILSQLARTFVDVDNAFKDYNFSQAARCLYEFYWGQFCDWYIEMSKGDLYGTDDAARELTSKILYYVQTNFLKLLHPFMPFITEKIWELVYPDSGLLMVERYPTSDISVLDEGSESKIMLVQDVISSIRKSRSENRISPGTKIETYFVVEDRDVVSTLKEFEDFILSLAGISVIDYVRTVEDSSQYIKAVSQNAEVYFRHPGFDAAGELIRLYKDLEKVQRELDFVRGKLDNKEFLTKAPPEVVRKQREKMASLEEIKNKLESQIDVLKPGA